MRRHLLIGTAALLGVMSWSGQAQAVTCNDYRSEARKTNDLRELGNLRTLATGCAPSVINDIQARIDAAQEGIDAAPGTTTPVVEMPSTSGAAAAAANAAPAQRAPSARPLALGQTAVGALTEQSATDPERGGPADLWSFSAPAGERMQISMESEVLDTYLVLGRISGGAFVELDRNDDRGDGTLNSRIRFTPEEAGEYVIRARTFSPGGFGSYTITAQPTASLPVARAVPQPLTLGQVAQGNLGPGSAVDEDQGYSYDLWTFEAAAEQRLQAAMVAPDLNVDTYLVIGRMQGGAFTELASNDDRGDGTFNSFMRFTAPETGQYTIVARSFAREQFGNYELLVAPIAPVSERNPLGANTNAWVLRGELEAQATGDFEDFEFQPRRGRRYSVRALGDGFTPMLDIGALEGAQLIEVDFYLPGADRAANSAEFTADRRGRYILRVSALAPSSGQFDLIITEGE